MEFYSSTPEILYAIRDEMRHARIGPDRDGWTDTEALEVYVRYLSLLVTGVESDYCITAVSELLARSRRLGPEVVNQELALAERAIAQEEPCERLLH